MLAFFARRNHRHILGLTEEALRVLRGLLEAWQELATRPTAALNDAMFEPAPHPSVAAPMPSGTLVGAGSFAAGGARR